MGETRCFRYKGGYILTTKLIDLLRCTAEIYDDVPIWRIEAVEEITSFRRPAISRYAPARYKLEAGSSGVPDYWGAEDILELLYRRQESGPLAPHNRDAHKACLKQIITDLVLCGVSVGDRTGGLHQDILRWVQASVCGVGYWEIISSRIDHKSPTLGSFLPDTHISIDYLIEPTNWMTFDEIISARKKIAVVSLAMQITESEEKVDDLLSVLDINKEATPKAIPRKLYDRLQRLIRSKKGELHVGQVL